MKAIPCRKLQGGITDRDCGPRVWVLGRCLCLFGWLGAFVLSGCVRLPFGETEQSVLSWCVPLLLGEIGRDYSWIVASPRRIASAHGEATLEEKSLLILNLENGERWPVQAPPGVLPWSSKRRPRGRYMGK